ncbi:hypothetical protein CBR_g48653 [Chara braunii]|uniref:TLC domain-containing protein n=1 Tax=Chara braunii TaxID=69332 RepID=A0A388M396_CHABU|nr:hypothetical protein CBR_g48653 [Chara braunii]|eukprot:GBG89044.1 hypothetical protein CBR_g48653 [Chara braunii]
MAMNWEEESFPQWEDYSYLLPSILSFLLIRLFLDQLVLERMGQSLLFRSRVPKKLLSKHAAEERRKKLVKFKESAWKFLYYTSAEALVLFITYNEPWFGNTKAFWEGWPNQRYKLKLKAVYFYTGGFYTYSIFALCFWETRRKDFSVTMSHHIATVFLILFSYISGFARVGSIVLAIHDVNDVFLEMAKICKYLKFEAGATFNFSVFVISWVVLRLVYYPFWIIYSTSYECLQVLNKEECPWACYLYYMFNTLLITLLVLHIYWWVLIFRMGIAKTERHDQELISAVSGLEGSLVDIAFNHLNLVVAKFEIDLAENCAALHHVQQIINPRKGLWMIFQVQGQTQLWQAERMELADRAAALTAGADDKVYACTVDTVYAYSSDGTVSWTVPLREQSYCQPTIAPIIASSGELFIAAAKQVLIVTPPDDLQLMGTVTSFFNSSLVVASGGNAEEYIIIGMSISASKEAIFINAGVAGVFCVLMNGTSLWADEKKKPTRFSPIGNDLSPPAIKACGGDKSLCIFFNAPAVDQCDGNIYLCNLDGFLYAVHGHRPSLRWRTDLQLPGPSTIAGVITGNNGRVYVATAAPGYLFAYTTNGTLLWQKAIGTLDYSHAFCTVDENGTHFCLILLNS